MAAKPVRPGRARTDLPTFFGRVLVVSGSPVFRELMRLLLEAHAQEVLFASNRDEGLDQLMEGDPVGVVLCDVSLPDGDGFQLLDDVSALPDAKPEVILIASQALASDAQLATQRGAAYLSKPVSFRHIASAIKQHGCDVAQRERRRGPGGRVCLLGLEEQIGSADAAHPQLLWYASDLSATGAFIESGSPLPLGSTLDLAIDIANIRIRVKAEVVRIQEPSWCCRAGIGVRFVDYGATAREALQAYVSQGGTDTY